MNTVEKINEQIAKEYEGKRADESLFLLGVELGRYLEQQGMEDVLLDFFSQQRLDIVREKEIDEIFVKMNVIAEALVKPAIAMQLKKHGEWSIGTNEERGYGKLDDDVANATNVQLWDVRQEMVEGDLDLVFEVTGKLADILYSHRYPPYIFATVENDYENVVELSDENDWDDKLVEAHFYNRKKDSVEQVTAIFDDLSRYALFEVVKNV